MKIKMISLSDPNQNICADANLRSNNHGAINSCLFVNPRANILNDDGSYHSTSLNSSAKNLNSIPMDQDSLDYLNSTISAERPQEKSISSQTSNNFILIGEQRESINRNDPLNPDDTTNRLICPQCEGNLQPIHFGFQCQQCLFCFCQSCESTGMLI